MEQMKDVKFNVLATPAKLDEIHAALKGYWENDTWNMTDPFFAEFRPAKWTQHTKKIGFSQFKSGIKEEINPFSAPREFLFEP
jgi:hypothetical protein